MKKYTISDYRQIENLIDRYTAKGGDAIQLDDGVLLIGNWILYGDGLYTFECRETPLTSWTSEYRVTRYTPRETPEYIREIIAKWEAGALEMVDG